MAETDCLFCRIVSGDVSADIVAESDLAVAFRDVNPQAPVHVLAIPRKHRANIAELAADDDRGLLELFRLAVEAAEREGVAEGGYRLVANTNADAHQTVFHAHVHMLGGRSMGWPPG